MVVKVQRWRCDTANSQLLAGFAERKARGIR